MRLIRIFYRVILLLFKCKFVFSLPDKKKIILFDCDTIEEIKKFFDKTEIFILSTRVNRFKKIYINKKIIFYILQNFFKRKLKINYLLSIINCVNPKIIITKIDNSPDFHSISKEVYKKIYCIAVQGAHRGDLLCRPKNETKNFFIPHFFSFSNYEKKLYRKREAIVKNFYPCGSLTLALAKKYIKKRKIKNTNIYDICLISEPHRANGDFAQVKNFADTVGLISVYTHRLCEEENLKLIFCGEGEKNSKIGKNEINFYENYLGKNNFKIFQSPRKRFPSYQKIFQSKLIIGHNSTILRESIGFNKKILYCNFTGSKLIQTPASGLLELRDKSYKEFKKRVLKILSLTNKQFFNQINKSREDIIVSPDKTYKIISDKINFKLT